MAQELDVTRGSINRWLQWYAVKMAVAYGLEHRSLEGVTEIGVDEVMWRAGKRKYLTVVYQINEGCRRLLWIGKDRKKKTLEAFFKWFGRVPTSGLQASPRTCGSRS